MITLHVDDKPKKESHILASDDGIAIMDISKDSEKESWVYEISKILTNHPEEWHEYIKDNKFYSIVKHEFDQVTEEKTKMDLNHSEHSEQYRKELYHLASACILTIMEL